MNALQTTLLTLALCAPPTLAAFSGSQDAAVQDQEQMMAEMMAKAAKYTQPGEAHQFLEHLLGDWDVSASLIMGGEASPPAKGTSSTRWQVEGRWLISEWEGSIMGMQGKVFHVMGYDNLKMSFVWTGFGNFDTAMNHAEGDMAPDGKTLILYGTLDEYLTGEHDKMVKYVYRFDGATDDSGELTSVDSYTLEVHDLPIGEENTKVMEFSYTRKK